MSSQDPLADRLHSAAIHLLRRLAEVDAETGLSAARLSALSVVVYGGPMTMTELARAERVSPSTVTSTVTGLEAAALVVRRRDPAADGRTVVVAATAKGKRLLTAARRRRLRRLDQDLDRLPARDRAALVRGVDALERLLAKGPC
jgi:DNA-binding MarR family transcriptional regulator